MKKKLFKKSNPKSFDTKNFKMRHFYQKKGISDLNYLRSLTYLTAKLISKIEIELKKKVDFWIFAKKWPFLDFEIAVESTPKDQFLRSPVRMVSQGSHCPV